MNVVWTTDAENSFEQNIAYLQEEWDDFVIMTFIEKTEEAIAYIAHNPALYPLYDKKKKIRRCVLVKQISLYYRITKTNIELLLFWNNYQDPKKLKLK
jgi:hypothetical protein